MPFMDQVSNANFLSQCEPVFGRELQHVLHGPASHVVFSEDSVALSQRLQDLVVNWTEELKRMLASGACEHPDRSCRCTIKLAEPSRRSGNGPLSSRRAPPFAAHARLRDHQLGTPLGSNRLPRPWWFRSPL